MTIFSTPDYLFWGMLVLMTSLVFTYYGVWDWWSMGPVSVHRWRQSDSISQVLMYFENGLHFFDHKVHNLEGEGGAAVSEFPILYYLSAILYTLFGKEPGILRVLHFSLLLWGLFHYAQIVKSLTNKVFLGLLAALLVLGSPLIAFYGFNFLPNTPALGCLLIGFGHYYLFLKNRKASYFSLFIIFNLLAGLLKATMLVPFLAWLGTWIILKLLIKNPEFVLSPFYPKAANILKAALIVLGVNVIWILWVRYYNASHGSINFLTTIYPLWELSGAEADRIWDLIWYKRFTRWFAPLTFYVILVCTVAIFIRKRKIDLAVWLFFMLLWAGAGSVFLLFYFQFQHHDYYLFDLMYAPLASLIFLLVGLEKWWQSLEWPDSLAGSIPGLKVLVVLLAFAWASWNLSYAKAHLENVFRPEHSDMRGFPLELYDDKEGLRAYVNELGLQKGQDKVLVLPDPSFNVGLYYLNMQGFSHQNVALPGEKWKRVWNEGVRYVVVVNKDLQTHPDLFKDKLSFLGSYKDVVFFYKMKDPNKEE
jgi:hypothetical protein